jgi:hypothetical protein
MQFHAWEHGPLPTFWAVWAQRLEKKKPLTTQRCRETKKQSVKIVKICEIVKERPSKATAL